MSKRLDVAEAAALIHPRDTVATGLATGQPPGLLEALGERGDFDQLVLYSGLFARPYQLLMNPRVRTVSGFFGPVERMARDAGADIEYLPADFIGLEQIALHLRPRVVLAATTLPGEDGYLSFGVHAGATYRAFLDAAHDPDRVTIVEANVNMPWVAGLEELGGNRIHASEVDAIVVHESDLFALASGEPSETERAIARNAERLIEEGSTLQFGIGTVPNEIARLLAEGPKGNFSIHSEMISDGVMALHESGSVTNRKELYPGLTVATFALGSSRFYRWLDRNPHVRIAPVSSVNDIGLIRRLRTFVSTNAALAIDLRGQVVADHIGGRQYSGIGGHETFIMAATECPDGKSLLCMESTAEVGGRRRSKIIPRVPDDTTVTTPRQHVQYVVTEYGAVDLSTLGDKSRPAALIDIAHPEFRDWLREESKKL
jgi:acyl-CoA hydrolase